jgi:WD40 repeat protein
LWDRTTQRILQQLTVSDSRLWKVAYLPDGRTLAVLADKVCLVEVASGKIVAQTADTDRVEDMAVSPDGRWIATAEQGGARQWEISTGLRTQVFALGQGSAMAVAFTPDGSHLATLSSQGGVDPWPLGTIGK